MNEKLSSSELYDAVITIIRKIDDRKRYIQEILIPKMDNHREGPRPQTRKEVVKKLLSADLSKPGEAVEIIEESVRAKRQLTPELALEIADVVYYTLQPNCPEWASDPRPFITQGLGLGVDMKTAYALCIVKYESHLLHGEPPNYKEIEKEIMVRFLESLPKSETNPQS